MRLKPVRFIGHKIGPFDHIELNWEKESRHTLIVAENGMGKTTLVAAMAACLSFGNDNLFPAEHFQRFAHDEESFAYLEIEFEGKIGWIFRWALRGYRSFSVTESLSNSNEEYFVASLPDWELIESTLRPAPTNLPDWLTLQNAIFIDHTLSERGFQIQTVCSDNLLPILEPWYEPSAFKTLTAAYGVGRDLQEPKKIREQQDLDEKNALEDILNPFAPIPSTEIFQWIANQYIYHALAISENKPDEAEAYLHAIRRVERLLSESLEYPISFQIKRNPFRLEVTQNGTILPVDQLSDGTRSFLSWPLDYLMRASRVNWANPTESTIAPGLVLVDEVDAHLHPEWQRRVMPVVSKLLPETYVIATTHSPFVLGATDDAQVFQIYKDEQGRLSARSSFDELFGYPADIVLEKAFVPSLYAPEVEQKLLRLSELAGKVAGGDISPSEKEEHDKLLQQLAEVNPWLNSVLALSQTKEPVA